MKNQRSPIIRPAQMATPSHDSRTDILRNCSREKPRKTRVVVTYLKTVTYKVAGVFSALFLWKKKVNSERDEESSYKYKGGHVGELSFSTTSSVRSSRRASSSYKHSSSYGYGSPMAFSEQIGTFDISFQEIRKATGNFSPANKIGEGGFGTVYKAKLQNGSLVAVKRAKRDNYDQRLSAEFKNEILALSKIEHLNLVRFYGYMESGGERIIIVEYVSNGTLREHLDGTRGNGLETAERLEIAIDVAHAIAYLHTYSDPSIIHRDIKASNILITDKLRAKVADFGFARFAAEDPSATHISTQIKGTAGYLDPEYLRTYQLTEKSDVYSFGVLLVEMVTGRHPIEPKRDLDERMTVTWALRRLKQREAIVAMDPRLRRSAASNQAVEMMLKLARQCLNPTRESRPSMRKCAELLWGIRKDFKEQSLLHSASTSQYSGHVAKNARLNRKGLFGIEESDLYKFHSA